MNICYTSRDFQPSSNKLDANKYKFIGPSISEGSIEADQTDYSKLAKPLVYVSLGTILSNNDFLEKCLIAFNDFKGSIVMAVGNSNLGNLAPIKQNFIVTDYVNQIGVLKNADVFLTHGGMNSVLESLYFGVPLLVFPYHTEQKTVAKQVVRTGCGLLLKNIRSSTILKSVNAILENEQFKNNCLNFGKTLKEAGGSKQGVDEIFKFKLDRRITN